MCGIAGWNLKEKPSEHFVAAMAYGILERGYDSWGYFDGTDIHKAVGPIVEGIRAHEMLSPAGFIHTRQATTGKVNAKNSHPFAIGNIVGAHNGVIYNHSDVQKEHKRSLPVDSMHIFQHMVEGKPLTDLEGYGAIEFYRDGEWYVGACNAGALVVARLTNDAGVIWASTEDCIRAAVFQGGYDIATYYTIEQGKIYRVAVDCLYETGEVFDLSKKPAILSAPSNPYGGCADYRYGNAGKRQENWYQGMRDDSDLPASFLDSITTESTYDECEFCNEIGVLTELYGSMVCQECRAICGEDNPKEATA